MFSVVEICVDYGGVYLFHVCYDVCVVYGAGVCVNACGVSCVDEYCLFLAAGCCLLYGSVMGVWGVVIFVSYVMRVIGGVLLWVVCVFIVYMLCVGVCCAPSCYSECGISSYL